MVPPGWQRRPRESFVFFLVDFGKTFRGIGTDLGGSVSTDTSSSSSHGVQVENIINQTTEPQRMLGMIFFILTTISTNL